jgi:ABC-type lipoprotein export system ATPase subunit
LPLLEARELVKVYRVGTREVRALDGVTLALEEGSLVGVTGRSGSGKTTLLNLIGCLERPTSGVVTIEGMVVSLAPERFLPKIRRSTIGFVFQRFHLLPNLTALENVMLPLRYSRVAPEQARRRALELLAAVEMQDRVTHFPSELAGGEQQRVAIARALVNHPKLILADEPTGELDSETASNLIRLIKTLNQTTGQTFVIVTHDDMITTQVQRVIKLKDGKIGSDVRVSSLE